MAGTCRVITEIILQRTAGTQSDKFLPGDIGEGDMATFGPLARAGNNQDKAVNGEGPQFQTAVIHGIRDHTDIGGTACHRLDDLGAETLLQIDIDIGPDGEKGRKPFRQEFRHGRSIRHQANMTFQTLREFAQLPAHLFDLPQDNTGMVRNRIASRCGCDAAAAAFEQRETDDVFHAAQAGTGRWQRHVGLRGTMGDASGFHNQKKETQIGQVETHA